MANQHASGPLEYSGIDSREYQDNNRRAWHEFLSGSMSHLPTDEVLEGWRRSRENGVDPDQRTVKTILSPEALAESRERNKLFLEVSRPMMESLYAFVSSIGFVIALSDHRGRLLDILGDENLQTAVERGNWCSGADWSERSAGNNVVGTALQLDKPMMVIGYEHYCRCSHRHGGASAPIHNGGGEIIGVIAMVSVYENMHPHTLGMVVAAARAIEMQLELRNAWLRAEVASQHARTIVESVSDGLLVTDTEDTVIFCNDKAARLLRMDREALLGRSLRQMLQEAVLREFRSKVRSGLDKETVFLSRGAYVKTLCSYQHVIRDGRFHGMVLVVNDYSRAERLARRIGLGSPYWTKDNIAGKSPVFLKTVHLAAKAAGSDSNIMLLGESGSGKDVFAQLIHNASPRSQGPYVAINCAALPKELISSELFGYSEGAFTGAKKGGNKGKVELADKGTLFLDEIGEIPLEQQTVLLRLLENRSVQKIGGGREVPVDIRIIAATNKNLEQEVVMGRFRQDLYFRLNVFAIRIPPLRDRKEDIPDLAETFLQRLALRNSVDRITIDEDALEMLMAYNWPGNIRELQNVLERAYTLSESGSISAEYLAELREQELFLPLPDGQAHRAPYQRRRDTLTAKALTDALEKHGGNITKASMELGIARPTMYRKMEQFGIDKGPRPKDT